MIENTYIDLIIVHIMMPKIDVYELTQRIEAYDPSNPILMVTAENQLNDIEKELVSKTDDYMVKSVHLNELVLRVSALRRHKLLIKKIIVSQTVLDHHSFTLIINGAELIYRKDSERYELNKNNYIT